MRRRASASVSVALLAVAVLTACAPQPAPSASPSAASTDAAATDAPNTAPSDAPGGETADPTCETIIPRTTAADFQSIGWAAQSEEFRIGATEISGGILCKWSNGSATADRVQMFGWAPIDDSTASRAQNDLVDSGWKREEGANGDVYVTENPDWIGGRGVDGYGITYLFGNGWVKVADTKQSLVLIDWPSAQR